MRRRIGSAFLATAAILCGGCGGDDGGGGAPAFTVATYNAGLATGFVEYADERLPLIGPAVAALDADVVCLQEVWTQAQADAVLAAAKDAFPHQYYEVTKGEWGDTAAACREAESGPLGACAKKRCGDKAPGDLAKCVLGNCKPEFDALSSPCVTCVGANVGKALQEILDACAKPGAAVWTYDGRNGLILLSKHPLSGTEYRRLDSYLIVRVVLHAVAAVPEAGSVDVFCTHTTADFGTEVPYAGKDASWGEEQGKQLDAILGWMGEREDKATPTVLLGDLNCGPAKGSVTAVHPENFAKLAAAGMAVPYADQGDPACTFCGSNPLVGDDGSEVIDHVAVAHPAAGTAYEPARVLDQPVTIQSGGQPVETRLSDHYGVKVRITLP
ncbi:MAG: endonuclease/exonuclease/phosphatase family protein [Deltaproteobacteria bacterium]|nr:endonuclease/exonuclease/phosphatase family protein [Deltaproteobacteria bacterium]